MLDLLLKQLQDLVMPGASAFQDGEMSWLGFDGGVSCSHVPLLPLKKKLGPGKTGCLEACVRVHTRVHVCL